MRRVGAVVAVAAGAVGAVAAGRMMRARQAPPPDRWHSVTINREPEQVGHLPAPLDTLGETIEVRVRPAPGGRGTEVAARCVEPDRDRVRALRKALREARSLAEVGEVLLPDRPTTTRPTVLNRPLAYATRHGREEGRL